MFTIPWVDQTAVKMIAELAFVVGQKCGTGVGFDQTTIGNEIDELYYICRDAIEANIHGSVPNSEDEATYAEAAGRAALQALRV